MLHIDDKESLGCNPKTSKTKGGSPILTRAVHCIHLPNPLPRLVFLKHVRIILVCCCNMRGDALVLMSNDDFFMLPSYSLSYLGVDNVCVFHFPEAPTSGTRADLLACIVVLDINHTGGSNRPHVFNSIERLPISECDRFKCSLVTSH